MMINFLHPPSYLAEIVLIFSSELTSPFMIGRKQQAPSADG